MSTTHNLPLSALTAITPIDGRYGNKVEALRGIFSEFGLIRARVLVEIRWLQQLARHPYIEELPSFSPAAEMRLEQILSDFGLAQAEQIKATERTTNHDVKAVEYFIKKVLDNCDAGHLKEWVHFGLTSQDINNTAIPLLWKNSIELEYLPAVINLQHAIGNMALAWKDIPMLARTHGQPASPTRLGKEMMVFVERLENQIQLFSYIPFTAKFGGATGNFNAHHVAFPKYNWIKFANDFTETKLGLQRQQFTTQIEHYDTLAAHFDAIKRINSIIIDFCRDIWTYVSMDYFKQKTKKGEIGSSAMPHKVNPIDFENAEGNLGVANALFAHLSEKLPISRLQRDLTDSTVTRTIGVPMAHTLLSVDSIAKGLDKLLLNEAAIDRDLEAQWAVVAEGIQTILRRAGYPEPYERLKDLTRGKERIGEEDIKAFIDGLDVSDAVKQQLRTLSPRHYTGMDLLGRVTS